MTSHAQPSMLVAAILDELLRALERRRAPIVSNLRPGLTASEIDGQIAPFGLTLPDEARTLWSWRDGANFEGVRREDCLIGPHWLFPSLSYALERRESARAVASDARMLDDWWDENWLQVMTGDEELVCDCSVSSGQPTPIRVFDPETSPVTPVVPSLGALVRSWIAALDDGVWTYGVEDGFWHTTDPRPLLDWDIPR